VTATIRAVVPADADAIAAIYAPYVAETTITFEEEVPDAAEITARIARLVPTFPWLVAERDSTVVGYAYGYPYRARAAYRWVAETGIYVARDARGGGIGTPLYEALLDALEQAGYVAAIGVLALPNPASEALHARLGFRNAGVQRRIGFKHGQWLDVGFWQRDLRARPLVPAEPGPA
jgi:L-amino acid N-acyltransferase YncA